MFSHILLPLDLDEPSSWRAALPVALSLARHFRARLTLYTVISNAHAAAKAEWSAIGYRELLSVAEARLANLASEIREPPEISTRVGSGNIWRSIIGDARELGADLIVMSAHRPEMKDYLIGAHAAGVVRHADCSVFIVRE
ncbi:universal stress protein [Allosphingosinicella flava]|uniref:Universal stress protein n=1 Tax=Allosphingosinicella flava TaxID=2771430 RepID=A0A7T2LLW8_9SPHN|nr:universal stress protein [Sphingosinicella flava]QPQ54955.1 universal stress protein [Sphingosinicella flava]